jgi:hypothetical protein
MFPLYQFKGLLYIIKLPDDDDDDVKTTKHAAVL